MCSGLPEAQALKPDIRSLGITLSPLGRYPKRQAVKTSSSSRCGPSKYNDDFKSEKLTLTSISLGNTPYKTVTTIILLGIQPTQHTFPFNIQLLFSPETPYQRKGPSLVQRFLKKMPKGHYLGAYYWICCQCNSGNDEEMKVCFWCPHEHCRRCYMVRNLRR